MYFVPKITIISFLTEYQKYANIVYAVNQHLYVWTMQRIISLQGSNSIGWGWMEHPHLWMSSSKNSCDLQQRPWPTFANYKIVRYLEMFILFSMPIEADLNKES